MGNANEEMRGREDATRDLRGGYPGQHPKIVSDVAATDDVEFEAPTARGDEDDEDALLPFTAADDGVLFGDPRPDDRHWEDDDWDDEESETTTPGEVLAPAPRAT